VSNNLSVLYITDHSIIMKKNYTQIVQIILGVVKRNPLFLHEIEWKNNGFLFTTSNIYIYT